MKIQNEGFTQFNAGSFSDLFQHQYTAPFLASPVKGKLFLKEILGLTGMEVSINRMKAGSGVPFLHAHRTAEELFFVISGTGEMLLDNQRISLEEGSCVRVSPSTARTIKAGDEDLVFLVVQAKSETLDASAGSDGFIVNQPVVWQ